MGQHAVVKAGHGADLRADEGENEQPAGAGDTGVRVLQVQAECGLVVGPGRDQPVGAAGPECCCFQELGREFAAMVFKRNRRHGQPDVAGEQGDDRVKVAVLVGPGEPGDQLLLCSGARGQGRPGFPRGRQPAPQGGA